MSIVRKLFRNEAGVVPITVCLDTNTVRIPLDDELGNSITISREDARHLFRAFLLFQCVRSAEESAEVLRVAELGLACELDNVAAAFAARASTLRESASRVAAKEVSRFVGADPPRPSAAGEHDGECG